MKVKLPVVECKQCGWRWTPITEDVRSCANPKCRSKWFDTEKAPKRREHTVKQTEDTE